MLAAGGRSQPAELVSCQLTLAAAAARPGETVTALLQVSCSQPQALELQEVEVEFSGIERVDTSWVQPTYRQSTPPINKDKRKVQRYIVQSRLQAATQGTFSDLSLRRFVVRFTLPPWLPPTFRGTAVRYLYYLQATVKYREAPLAQQDGSSGADVGGGIPAAEHASAPATGAVSMRAGLHIWPARQQQQQALDAAERSPALPPGAASNSHLSEEMPIKCWEIGPGTAVHDAVAHIIKLASQPQQAARPPSPGGRLGRGGSLGVGPVAGGGTAGDESSSEISHEPQEAEQRAQGPGALPGSGAGVPGRTGLAPGAPLASLPQPPPLRVPPPQLQQEQHDRLQQQEREEQRAPQSSGASTPLSRPPSRRPSLARASLDQASLLVGARSPLHPGDSGSSLRSYALRIGDQPLVRVSIHPPLEGSLQPGSTLAGTLDFAPSQPQLAASAAMSGQHGSGTAGAAAAFGPMPRCAQVLILLETEELVDQAWRRRMQGGGTGAIRHVHAEHLEVTADTACTHFLFTIPPDGVASFQTSLVQLRWLLRFQFTASMPPGSAAAAAQAGKGWDWNPLHGRLEQLTWALPVIVVPPS